MVSRSTVTETFVIGTSVLLAPPSSNSSCGGRHRRMRSQPKGIGGRQILLTRHSRRSGGGRLLHPVTVLHSVSRVASPEQYQDKDIYDPNHR